MKACGTDRAVQRLLSWYIRGTHLRKITPTLSFRSITFTPFDNLAHDFSPKFAHNFGHRNWPSVWFHSNHEPGNPWQLSSQTPQQEVQSGLIHLLHNANDWKCAVLLRSIWLVWKTSAILLGSWYVSREWAAIRIAWMRRSYFDATHSSDVTWHLHNPIHAINLPSNLLFRLRVCKSG